MRDSSRMNGWMGKQRLSPSSPAFTQVTFVNSSSFVGLAAGGILFGVLADSHGRRAALYAATALTAAATLLGGLAPSYWVHWVFRTASAVGVQVGGAGGCGTA